MNILKKMSKINKGAVISITVKNEARNLPYLFKSLGEIKKTFLKGKGNAFKILGTPMWEPFKAAYAEP